MTTLSPYACHVARVGAARVRQHGVRSSPNRGASPCVAARYWPPCAAVYCHVRTYSITVRRAAKSNTALLYYRACCGCSAAHLSRYWSICHRSCTLLAYTFTQSQSTMADQENWPMYELLNAANSLILSCGLSPEPLRNAADLQSSASSLFVALFESLFDVRLPGILRSPNGLDDLEYNAGVVLEALRSTLPPKVAIPADITGHAVASGDLPSIAFLVRIFTDLARILPPPTASPPLEGPRDVLAAQLEESPRPGAARSARRVHSSTGKRRALRSGTSSTKRTPAAPRRAGTAKPAGAKPARALSRRRPQGSAPRASKPAPSTRQAGGVARRSPAAKQPKRAARRRPGTSSAAPKTGRARRASPARAPLPPADYDMPATQLLARSGALLPPAPDGWAYPPHHHHQAAAAGPQAPPLPVSVEQPDDVWALPDSGPASERELATAARARADSVASSSSGWSTDLSSSPDVQQQQGRNVQALDALRGAGADVAEEAIASQQVGLRRPGQQAPPPRLEHALAEEGPASAMAAVSGEGLGPDGRPGTAVGGSRAMLYRRADPAVHSWQAEEDIVPAQRARPDELAAHVDDGSGSDLWAQQPPSPIASGRDAHDLASDDATWQQQQQQQHLDMAEEQSIATPDSLADAYGPSDGLITSRRGVQVFAPQVMAVPAFSSHASSSGVGGGSARSLPPAAAEMLRQHSKRRLAATRRAQNLVHNSQARLAVAQQSMAKQTAAAFRVQEQKYLKREQARARATQHGVRMQLLRTQRMIESLQLENLSLRMGRASSQAEFLTQLAASQAAQERVQAIDAAQWAKAEARARLQREEAALMASAQSAAMARQAMADAATVAALDRAEAAQQQAQAVATARARLEAATAAQHTELLNQLRTDEQRWQAGYLHEHAAPEDVPDVFGQRTATRTVELAQRDPLAQQPHDYAATHRVPDDLVITARTGPIKPGGHVRVLAKRGASFSRGRLGGGGGVHTRGAAESWV